MNAAGDLAVPPATPHGAEDADLAHTGLIRGDHCPNMLHKVIQYPSVRDLRCSRPFQDRNAPPWLANKEVAVNRFSLNPRAGGGGNFAGPGAHAK